MKMPTVDFERLGLAVENDDDAHPSAWLEIGQELIEGFASSGFAYIINHGIPRSAIDELNNLADDFFLRPLEYKMQHNKELLGLCYDPLDSVRANLKRLPDHNEGLRFPCRKCEGWPDIDNLKTRVRDFQKKCKILTLRLLRALGVALKLKDKDLFWRSHALMGQDGNQSILKLLRYPPLTDPLPENQLRVGEHGDASTLTLLFPDGIGGLQIQAPGGDFVDVPRVTGAILLNIGDILLQWTRGKLKSTIHRVVEPTDSSERAQVRRSVAFFTQADDTAVLREPAYKIEEGCEEESDENITASECFQKLIYNRLRIDDA